MTLLETVNALDRFDERALILFLPEGEIGPSTEVVLVVPPPGMELEEVTGEQLGHPGHRVLIDVRQAWLALEAWRKWGEGTPPGPEKAVEVVLLWARVVGGLRPPTPSAEEEIERALGEGRRRLSLRRRRLTELPRSIATLSSLETLDVSDNLIQELPEEIGCLPNLERLTLRNNRLRRLPDSICKLARLVVLDLSGNALDALPGSIGEMSSLSCLLLKGNRIRELPPSLGRNPLHALNLEDNPIVPSLEGLSLAALLHRLRAEER